jgi:hypothetical protein
VTIFSPPRLLANRHVQTAFAGLPVLAKPPADAVREHVWLPLPDGDALHAVALWHRSDARRTAVLVHGLGGSTESAYLRRATRALFDAGHHVVGLDLRGAGMGAPRATRLYHAGIEPDVRAALEHIGRDPRVRDLWLIGFSLGGQVSLLSASVWGDAPPPGLRGVIAVCPPLDLAAASRRIEAPRARPYLRYVMRSLVGGAVALKQRRPEALAASERELRGLRTIRAYDELVIAPMHGFSSADAYYAACSSGPRLGDVRIEAHVIAAEDDPMVPADTLKPWLDRASGSVNAIWSARGGHLGFVSRLGEGVWKTWANERIARLLG